MIFQFVFSLRAEVTPGAGERHLIAMNLLVTAQLWLLNERAVTSHTEIAYNHFNKRNASAVWLYSMHSENETYATIKGWKSNCWRDTIDAQYSPVSKVHIGLFSVKIKHFLVILLSNFNKSIRKLQLSLLNRQLWPTFPKCSLTIWMISLLCGPFRDFLDDSALVWRKYMSDRRCIGRPRPKTFQKYIITRLFEKIPFNEISVTFSIVLNYNFDRPSFRECVKFFSHNWNILIT